MDNLTRGKRGRRHLVVMALCGSLPAVAGWVAAGKPGGSPGRASAATVDRPPSGGPLVAVPARLSFLQERTLADGSPDQIVAGEVRTAVVNEIMGLVHPCWFRYASVDLESPSTMSISVEVRGAAGRVEITGVQLVSPGRAGGPGPIERCMVSALRTVRRRIPVPPDARRLGSFFSQETVVSRIPEACNSR